MFLNLMIHLVLMSSEGQRVRSSKEHEVREKKGKSDPPHGSSGLGQKQPSTWDDHVPTQQAGTRGTHTRSVTTRGWGHQSASGTQAETSTFPKPSSLGLGTDVLE